MGAHSALLREVKRNRLRRKRRRVKYYSHCQRKKKFKISQCLRKAQLEIGSLLVKRFAIIFEDEFFILSFYRLLEWILNLNLMPKPISSVFHDIHALFFLHCAMPFRYLKSILIFTTFLSSSYFFDT